MYSPQVFMVNSGYGGCNYVRIYLPCVHNGFMTDKPSRMNDRISIGGIREQLMAADVVVFHRAEEPQYHELAKLLKSQGKKIVMDNDDTFLLDDHHPLANFNADGSQVDHLARRQKNIEGFMELCDLVTASTKTLAEEYSKTNQNTIVLPNYVDPDDWDEPLRNEGDKVRIGMVGSVAMEYDYLHVKELIRKLSERDDVEFVVMGLGDMEHRKKNPKVTKVFAEEYAFWDSIKKEHTPWVPNHLYNETLNELRLDLMLIPRKENYFNKCKSNVKFLEAAMCEVPVVAQSFQDGPYEEIDDWTTGVLVKDNEDWEEKIEILIQNKELRREIGKNAREYVLANYDIKDHAHKWADAYSKLFV